MQRCVEGYSHADLVQQLVNEEATGKKLTKKNSRGPNKWRVKIKPYLIPFGTNQIPKFGRYKGTDPMVAKHMEAGFGTYLLFILDCLL